MEKLSEANVKLLVDIQKELKAPKNNYNSFGKYAYRSAEDILEGAKPIAHARSCAVGCSDSVEFIEGRHYVVSHAYIMFPDGQSHTTSGYAREEESKKGMDGSQVTGAASSYARKYALNGLFAIDDTKDSDATNDGKGDSKPSVKPQQKTQPKTEPKPEAKAQPKPESSPLDMKRKELGDKCREYKKSKAAEQQPLEALLFDKLKANGMNDLAGMKTCDNELVFNELIDIIDLALGSAK